MYLDQYKAYLADMDRSPRTIAGYLRDLTRFARWFEQTNGEQMSPENLTSIDAREYRQYLMNIEKASPATINRKLAAVRSYAEWMVASSLAEVNALSSVRGVKEQETGLRWLEKKDQAALLRQLEKDVNAARTVPARTQALRNRAIVLVLLNTGLRVSELCDLELGDIEIAERKGSLVVREGKGRKARSIPLNLPARSALKEWLTFRPKLDTQKIFTSRRGDGLTPSAVQRFLTEKGQRCRVEVTPHRLRHTFCKNLVNAGVSLEKIAALAGHESIETTRRYVEPGAIDLERAVRSLEE